MPAPIMPAPSTPTFFASDFGTPDGRRAPFSAACLLIKVVRIMLRATGSVSSLAKYLLSTDSALSNGRSEEHTSELQSLMRISYAVFCLKKKQQVHHTEHDQTNITN